MKQNTPSTRKEENAAAEKKCIGCGKDVPVAAYVCPYCQRRLKCQKCGTELKAGWVVCITCGRKIVPEKAKPPLSQRIADLFKEVTKDENRVKLVSSIITGLIGPLIGLIKWDAVGLAIGTIFGVFVAIFTFKYIIPIARMAQMLIYGLLGGAIGGAIIGGVCWFIGSPILGPIVGYPTGGFVGRILAVIALGCSIVVVEMFVERQFFAKTAGRVVFGVVIGIIGWVVWEITFSSVHEIVFSRMSLAEGSGWAAIWVVIHAIAGAIVGIIISMFIAIRSRQQQK